MKLLLYKKYKTVEIRPHAYVSVCFETHFFFLAYWFSVHKTITKTQLYEKRSPEWRIDFPYWFERMKKEDFRKRDATVSGLSRNKHVSLPLALS